MYTQMASIDENSLGIRFGLILTIVISTLLTSFDSASHGGGVYSGMGIGFTLFEKLSLTSISVPPPFLLARSVLVIK